MLFVTSALAWSAMSPMRLNAEALRDPFTFGPGSKGRAAVYAEVTLNGILWDATHPLAIMGSEPVAVGDTVVGWEVVAIEQNRLVLQHGERREMVIPGNLIPSPSD